MKTSSQAVAAGPALGFIASVAFFSAVASAPASACSCQGPSFWERAQSARVIVLAEVARHTRPLPSGTRGGKPRFVGMEVAIKEVLRGKEDRQTIEFLGGECRMCAVDIDAFPVGTFWAFIVDGPETLDWCDGRWLPVLGDGPPLRDGMQAKAVSVEFLRDKLKRAARSTGRRTWR